ncbi:MAG: helix-turn-helix transcriptional regulator [Clostridiales bacterium]|nr:helix-turn-helix transcriptional regulator [Clostridiales bacterium]
MKRTRKLTTEGMLIKVLLSINNLTTQELADRIGKTEATVCDVISGKNKSEKTLNQILDVLRERQEPTKMAEFLQLYEEQFGGTNT